MCKFINHLFTIVLQIPELISSNYDIYELTLPIFEMELPLGLAWYKRGLVVCPLFNFSY